MATAGADAADEHSHVRPLTASIGVEFVEDEKAQVLVNGIAYSTFPHAGQEQFQHHVVRQEYLGRPFTHLLARRFPLLPRVLAEGDWERPPASAFVIFLVTAELLKLGIDQGVHWIDDNGRHPCCPRMGQHLVEYRTDVSQRLAGPCTRRDDEILAGSAQFDGLN